MSGTRFLLTSCFIGIASSAFCGTVVMRESFDALVPPALPPGWQSSQGRVAGLSDFFTTASSARSSPNALQCTNATVGQWIATPVIEAAGIYPSTISFWTRRSSTFGAAVVLEYSLDVTGSAFVTFGDTLWPAGGTSYVFHSFPFPPEERGKAVTRLRWRVIPAPTGSTGTFRIDDVEIDGQRETDLTFGFIVPSPGFLTDGERCTLRTIIRNTGRNTVDGFSIVVIANQDADSVERSPVILRDTHVETTLSPGDSILIETTFAARAPGGFALGILTFAGEGGISSDTASFVLPVAYRLNTFIVNEIMFSPRSGTPEWVEIINRSTAPITLYHWSMNDADTTAVHCMTRTPALVPPSGLALLTEDSLALIRAYGEISCPIIEIPAFPSLNNDEDMVVLHDHIGRTIDSVAYRAGWHNPALVSISGRSLERIDQAATSNDSRNWTSSTAVEGATPGKENSVHASTPPLGAGLVCSPNPFSPNGDGIDDVALIYYTTPLKVATISAFVYDVLGRRIRRLADNDPGSSHGTLLWDGRRDDGVRAPIGMYVVLLQAARADGGPLYEARCVVVLAMPL